MSKGFVKAHKAPISFEQMAEKQRQLHAAGKAVRTDEAWQLWEYPEDVEGDTVRRRIADYNEWAIKEGRLLMQSTAVYRPYTYEEVKDYRRKPRP
jgi:hypothetical protein